jgi:hypothetical protein
VDELPIDDSPSDLDDLSRTLDAALDASFLGDVLAALAAPARPDADAPAAA